MVEMAADFVRGAAQNVINFGAPAVEFAFTDLPGIPEPIVRQLEAAGVRVVSAALEGQCVLWGRTGGGALRRGQILCKRCQQEQSADYGHHCKHSPHRAQKKNCKGVLLKVTAASTKLQGLVPPPLCTYWGILEPVVGGLFCRTAIFF